MSQYIAEEESRVSTAKSILSFGKSFSTYICRPLRCLRSGLWAISISTCGTCSGGGRVCISSQ